MKNEEIKIGTMLIAIDEVVMESENGNKLGTLTIENQYKIKGVQGTEFWVIDNDNERHYFDIKGYEEYFKLKETFEDQLVKEIFPPAQEYTTVPGSDKKFLKPTSWKCEFFKDDGCKLFATVTHQLSKTISCIYDYNGACYEIDTASSKLVRWHLKDLTPYEQPWYEIESNFPCLIKADDNNISVAYEYQKDNGDLWCCYGYSIISAEQAIRLTNEEIESLKVKEV